MLSELEHLIRYSSVGANFREIFAPLVRSGRRVLLLLLLCTSLGLNVLLAHRVRQLGAVMGKQSRKAELQVGTLVPPIAARELDGKNTTVEYAGTDRLTMLYIFAPECKWCARNMDNLKALLKAKGESVRFIGLSLSQVGLADYVRANKLEIPILTGPSQETINAYKLGGTPQAIVISAEGRVIENWQGAWTNKEKADIEAFFHMNLPGIQVSSAAH